MRNRSSWIALVVALVILPALTAAGDIGQADGPQTLDVTVMGANEVSIWVEEEIGFGTIVAGSSYTREFGMGVTNTWTDGTWQVSVTGSDLVSYEWDCDDQGCTRVPDGISTIPASALTVYGGDQDNWSDENAIVPGSGALDTSPVILTGTAVAYGDIGIDNPQSSVELDLTSLTPDYANYYTELTYTIMHYGP